MTVYRKHKLEKKQAYQQQIQEVEHSSFTSLVLSATGGMGNEATAFISIWHCCLLRNGTPHTAQSYVGYGAA